MKKHTEEFKREAVRITLSSGLSRRAELSITGMCGSIPFSSTSQARLGPSPYRRRGWNATDYRVNFQTETLPAFDRS
jgi:hypothetical protein